MALWRRQHTGRPASAGLIHHSDAGSQYTSIRYTDTLALEGPAALDWKREDAYDNAAAETVMRLFKNEAVAKDSPFRTGALKTETDVMEIVFEWVRWYNNERLHSALDHQTPEEYEQTYYDLLTGSLPDDAANKQAARFPGRFNLLPAGHDGVDAERRSADAGGGVHESAHGSGEDERWQAGARVRWAQYETECETQNEQPPR
jgi:hypothetical protein